MTWKLLASDQWILRGRPSLAVSLGPRLFLAANVALLVGAGARIYDYLYIWLYSETLPAGLTTIESAAPLWLWSLALAVGAILVTIGSLDPPRLLALMWGHLILFVVNLMIGVGSLVQQLSDADPGGVRLGVTVLMGTAAMSLIFAVATYYRREALLELAQELNA